MDEQRCECHDFLVTMCPGRQRPPQTSRIIETSNPDDPAKRGFFEQLMARAEKGSWFPASWGNDCSGCGESFDAGDEIRADGSGGWEARCCDT